MQKFQCLLAICVEAIIYLLYDLHDCTFKYFYRIYLIGTNQAKKKKKKRGSTTKQL